MKRNEVDRKRLSPMMLQYMEIKDNYEEVILFFRLGDFYEMFFEDAINVSHELELTLTGKSAGLDERIPMCGVPHHAVNVYLDKLINLGYKVAICEQVEDPKDAKGVVKREVLQVVSKGTIMNGDSLDEKTNNYIGSILDFSHCYVLSYTDISTGDLYVSLIEHEDSSLIAEVLSLEIKELIVNNNFNINVLNILKNKYKININIYDNIYEKQYENLYLNIDDERYIKSINYLISYIENTQKRNLSHLKNAIIIENSDILKMDINTRRNLELTESLKLKNRNHSLLWLLDKTRTAMGSRLLKNWIENPIVSKKKILERHQIVEKLLEEFILKEELRALLYEVYDLERLCGRISYGNANARDLIQLKNSLKVLPNIKNILKDLNYYDSVDNLENLYDLLEKSINEDAPITIKEGSLIKKGYNKLLDEIKDSRKGDKDFLIKLEQEERSRTGIKNLKVGFNKVFGYYIEISKGSIKDIPETANYERKQTLANAERYITPLLKEKEELILGAEEKIINLEYELFIEIRNNVKDYISIIQNNAKVLSEIDVLQSFAIVSEENNYVRPNIIDERIIDIKNCRHPVVEKVIEGEFVPNDIFMDEKTNILLITGPNMSGKSTYMRSLVITIIMNQIGCFVPCSEASLPIFDKVFTRIGASDDLVGGESTFMVEMTEANNAIKNASNNSIIIFDELGRGTATYDGMALAQSIIEYIHDNIECKTLFSTHYHELTELEKNYTNIKNIHVSALEENGKIIFLHKIKEGAIDKSYGIHVAKLANLPDSLINRANNILKSYEKKEKGNVYIQENLKLEEPKTNNKVIDKLKDINILELNPLQALNILDELKNEIDK
ncbi:MAG: DNA mismatch repair protein MutS [Tenericutes bacterium]|nr:DNA mismatch repair protein MutS [Mycoplasmatota bacterium]